MFFFGSFWLIFYPLDPDPGCQNLADPTDPDLKHCLQGNLLNLYLSKNGEDIIVFLF